MKLIFLDFDGVLNSLRSCIAFHGYPFPNEDAWNKFDLVAIGLIKKLCKETGAKIVISSTWRIQMDISEIITMLKALGFPDAPIIGRTPSIGNNGGYNEIILTRGNEIDVWLKAYERGDISPALCELKFLGQKVEAYVIVDDDADMLREQLPFFVQTSFMDGLTLDGFLDMLHILDPKNKELNDIGRSIARNKPVHGTMNVG